MSVLVAQKGKRGQHLPQWPQHPAPRCLSPLSVSHITGPRLVRLVLRGHTSTRTRAAAAVVVHVLRTSASVLIVPHAQQLLHLRRGVSRQILPGSPAVVVHDIHAGAEGSHQDFDDGVVPLHAGDMQGGHPAAAPHVHVHRDPHTLRVMHKFEQSLILTPLGQPVQDREAADEILPHQQMRVVTDELQYGFIVSVHSGQHPGVFLGIQSPVCVLLGGDDAGLRGQDCAEAAVWRGAQKQLFQVCFTHSGSQRRSFGNLPLKSSRRRAVIDLPRLPPLPRPPLECAGEDLHAITWEALHNAAASGHPSPGSWTTALYPTGPVSLLFRRRHKRRLLPFIETTPQGYSVSDY